MRTVVWFSCGASSAVALKIACSKLKDVVAVYCDTGGEHEDNKRFLKDVEKWCGIKIIKLRNENFIDHFDVCTKMNYWANLKGAPCTLYLKKYLRSNYQMLTDVNIFGYTVEEKIRAATFVMQNRQLKTRWILIEQNITKERCLGIIQRAGIEIPEMYKMGYKHNNCIGCVKGGAGYWNKIRIDFPNVFNKFARAERGMGKCIILINHEKIYLDELDKNRGHEQKVEEISCDLFCEKIYRGLE